MANVGSSSSKQNQSNINESQRDTVKKTNPLFKPPASASPGQGYSYKLPTGGGVEVSPTGKATVITPKKSSGGGGGSSSTGIISTPLSPTGYSDTMGQPVSVLPSAQTKANVLSSQISKEKERPISTVEPIYRPSGLAGISYDISKQRDILSTKRSREGESLGYNVAGFGLGLATVGLGTINLVRHPISSVKSTVTSGYSAIKNFRSTGEKIGFVLMSEPGYATGIVAGTYLTGKATGYGVTKGTKLGVDLYRTKGLTEVKATDIIAPEFFKGQKYPQISKGETAGQLLTEFKIQKGGFTSAPKPLNVGRGILPGTSELPGLYQSPKVSPTFLRIAGEEKQLFSFSPFGTLRPTVSRIKPTGFELAPGIKTTSGVQPGKLPTIKKFFIEGAERGKSYVPFIKTEKEAVIPFGTIIEKQSTKSYFKFEGRRIPIEEFKTLKGDTGFNIKGYSGKGITTIEKVSYSGYKSIGSKSYFSPIDTSSLFGLGKSYKPYAKVSSSGLGISSSASLVSSSRSYPSVSKSNSYGSISSSGLEIIYSKPLISSSSYPISSISKVYVGISSSGYISSGFNLPIFSTRSLEPGESKIYKKKKIKGKKMKTKIAPSLTAELFDLRGALPKGGSFGISPFQIRRIPKGQKNPYATKF